MSPVDLVTINFKRVWSRFRRIGFDMFDVKKIRGLIKTAAGESPYVLMANAIDGIKEIKKDGYTTLSLQGDRVFKPGWSLLFSTVVTLSLCILVAISWLTIKITWILDRIKKILHGFCSLACCLLALPVAFGILGNLIRNNKPTDFAIKITKVKK